MFSEHRAVLCAHREAKSIDERPRSENPTNERADEARSCQRGVADFLELQLARLQCLFLRLVVEGKTRLRQVRTSLGAAAESGPGRFHLVGRARTTRLAAADPQRWDTGPMCRRVNQL